MHILAGNCVNNNEWVVQSQQIATTGFLPVCFFTYGNSGKGQALLLVSLWGLNYFQGEEMFLCNMLDGKIFCGPYFSAGTRRKQTSCFIVLCKLFPVARGISSTIWVITARIN